MSDRNQNLVRGRLESCCNVSEKIREILSFEEKVSTWKWNGKKYEENASELSSVGV